MKRKAILLTADGKRQLVEPTNGKDFQLDQLYQLLSCEMIEIVRLPDSDIMIIDEEGKLRQKPPNMQASLLAWGAGSVAVTDIIVGDALVCHTTQLK